MPNTLLPRIHRGPLDVNQGDPEMPSIPHGQPRGSLGVSAAVFLLFSSLLATVALAQEAMPPGQDPGMEAFIAAITPGEPHRYLASLEGEWTYSQAMWEVPGEEPMRATGEATKTMIMEGRYLQEEMHGEMMGQPFEGRGITGFDNIAQQFVGTWIDNMGTGVIAVHGEAADSGDAHTVYGEFTNPMSGEIQKLRMVTRKVDDDRHVFEYYVTQGEGPEVKQMEIEYTRKK